MISIFFPITEIKSYLCASFEIEVTMASTKLVRKALRNRAVSRKRVNNIKRLTSKPVIKNVDVDQIKEEFAKRKAKPAAKNEAPVKEAPEAEVNVEAAVEEAPKAEKAEKANVAEKKEASTPDAKEAKKTEPKADAKEAEKAEPEAEVKEEKKTPAKKAAPKAKKEAAPKKDKKEDSAE